MLRLGILNIDIDKTILVLRDIIGGNFIIVELIWVYLGRKSVFQ